MNRQKENRLAKGIYLLPNLFTIGALFAGFYSIVAAMQHLFENAAIAVFIAMVLDGVDGRVARLTNSQTEFGAQLDSMSDMACFGVAPALVLYNWSLIELGKIGWLAAFLYAASTALRLARFNAMPSEDKRYFSGISSTASAGMVAALVLAGAHYSIDGESIAYLILIFTVMMAFLQVSRIPYRSFKDLDLRGRVPFVVIFIVVMILVLISMDPPDILFLIFGGYTLSGFLSLMWRFIRRKKNQRKEVIHLSLDEKDET